MDYAGFSKGSYLVDYSRLLAMHLHQNERRDTGEPYTEHLRQVADFSVSIFRESRYKPSAVSAAWLHDSAEDINGFEVFNPFEPKKRTSNSAYLNELLEEAEERGEWICYITDRLSNRGGNYFDYMMKMFSVHSRGTRAVLDRLAIAMKIADRTSNSMPDEEMDVNGAVKEYLSLEGCSQEELVRFYKKHRVIDAFSAKGDYGIDTGLFAETKRRIFGEKKISNANDNLYLYLPIAERLLLVGIGTVNGRFEEAKALQNHFFDYHALRKLFRQCYEQSLQIVDGLLPSPQGTHLYIVRRSGYNRGNQIDGYTPILSELRQEKIRVLISENLNNKQRN